MNEFLDHDRHDTLKLLVKFFQYIRDGDALTSIDPEDAGNLSLALDKYKQAGKLAKNFPKEINVLFIAELKINDNIKRSLFMEDMNKKEAARDTFDKIIDSITDSGWENARENLFVSLQFLNEHLDKERKDTVESLVDFFHDINEGDEIFRKDQTSNENIDSAITLYKRAQQKATELSEDIDVLFLTQEKINIAITQKKANEENKRREQAHAAYDNILAGLTPEKWEETKGLLFEMKDFLKRTLMLKKMIK